MLDPAFPARRSTPLVTVLDGHPHTLAFLGVGKPGPRHASGRDPVRPVPSDLDALYTHHGLDTDSIVAAALA